MNLKEIKKALIGKGLNQFHIFVDVGDYVGSYYQPSRTGSVSRRAFEIQHIRYQRQNKTYVIADSKIERNMVWVDKNTIEELVKNNRVVERTFVPTSTDGKMGQYHFNDIAIEYYPIGDAYDEDNWKRISI